MKTLKYLLLGLLGLILALLIYGLIEPYFIDEEPQPAPISGLPTAWEGQRLAAIADWQVGMWLANIPTIRRIVDELVEKRPAAVLIAGDFIYGAGEDPSEEINQAVELVRPLPAAGIPTYAVLGNHDYGMTSETGNPDWNQAAQLASSLEAAGVNVLKNEAVALTPSTAPADPLYLVGIGAHWPNEDKPAAALAQVPDGAPRFVFMHHPDSFAEFPANMAPVAVAGHTHGGQIRLPLTSEWSWLTFVKSEAVHVDGWIDDYGASGNRLYVNRGIGFSVVPIRINCPPEVTYFSLQRA